MKQWISRTSTRRRGTRPSRPATTRTPGSSSVRRSPTPGRNFGNPGVGSENRAGGLVPATRGLPVLCLASGGGQQAPILAAAGPRSRWSTPRWASSVRTLRGERDGLDLETRAGRHGRPLVFPDGRFGLVVHPFRKFVPDVAPVWRECRRVLRPGGTLIAGFMNPDEFVFDADALDERGEFVVKYPLPYVEHRP